MEAKQQNTMMAINALLVLPFPQRVYNVLRLCEEQGREDIISWLNAGTAFRVNNVEEFERDILPNYFVNTKKYSSFTRALYSYGFACVRQGREQTGIFSHPSFNRNNPTSPSLMTRVRKKKSRTEAAQNRTVFNPFEASNNRSYNPRPDGLLNGQEDDDRSSATVFGQSNHAIAPEVASYPVTSHPVDQIPTGSELVDRSSTTVFGQSNHAIAPEVASYPVTSHPVDHIPTGSELVGIFDFEEGDSMGARPNPPKNTTSSATIPPSFQTVASSNGTAIDRQSGSLFILGGGDIVRHQS